MGNFLSSATYSMSDFSNGSGCLIRANIQLISYKALEGSATQDAHVVAETGDIPEHIWLRIFSYLTLEEKAGLSLVCRKWNSLCRDSTFWRNIDSRIFSKLAESITDGLVQSITSYSAAIQTLDLSGDLCTSITDASLAHVARNCLRLRKVNLSSRKLITNRGLANIARCCLHLEHVILNGCYKISSKGVKALRRCSMLTMLSIACCTRVTDKGLMVVIRKCHRLQVLNIDGCTKVSDKAIITLGHYSKLLRKVNFKNTTEISIEAIEVLVKGAPLLSHIQLGILQDEYRTLAALNIIVNHCTFLELLSYQHPHNQVTTGGERRIVSKKKVRAFVNSLNPCAFA